MTTAIRSLLAASAAAALLATPTARAHECDQPAWPAPVWAPPDAAPPPAVFREPAPPVLPQLLVHRWDSRSTGPFAELRAEYARLDLARDRFYAGWRGNPWTRRQFESWYAARRAELDRRSEWLTARAGWRPEHRPHGNAWGWRHQERDDDD